MNKKVFKDSWIDDMRRSLLWLAGVIVAVSAVLFTEGTIIAATKFFGVVRATLLRVVFTIPLSWLVIYLATRSKKSLKFTKWLDERQRKLSGKAKAAVEGGKFLVVANTAIFLGPIVASILMLMLGVSGRRSYAVICAFVSAWLWAAFYGGILCELARICR